MVFSSITTMEKIKALELAKKELEVEVYRLLGKLGYDPDSYALSGWNFDPESTNPDDERDYHIKKIITDNKERISILSAKIAKLSK